MPKVSVYLPDDLHEEARRAGLSLSSLTQAAVREALRVRAVDEWVAAMRADVAEGPSSPDDPPIDELMAEVADEFGA